ncbi:uncharacterized protein LOC141928917 [Strix aluco]|uniref:uncharacterized protein LOC141928917 n=1 Tax=Strix aluco TaxID=111821 RepID=UPI003DA22464
MGTLRWLQRERRHLPWTVMVGGREPCSSAGLSPLSPFQLLACADIDTEEFSALYKAQRYLRRPSPVMLSLVLTGFITLSKTPETVSGGLARGATSAAGGWGSGGCLSPLHKKATVCFTQARKLPVLLPDILETLTDANADVKTKALVLFINVMGHMKREEANLISLRLVEKLLPLFNDESSRLRELSIRLFKDVIKTAVGRNKKKMVKTVQSVLLPLFFYTSDQIESVAKASRDTLLACAEFLGWRRLSSMAKTCQTHLIGECLITHNRSRVVEYLHQSLPYLKDPQATVREEAVRFIGLAARSRRILSQERLWEICNALLPLRKDTELSVRSLAAETVSILTIEQRPISRWSLRSLFCWPCWSHKPLGLHSVLPMGTTLSVLSRVPPGLCRCPQDCTPGPRCPGEGGPGDGGTTVLHPHGLEDHPGSQGACQGLHSACPVLPVTTQLPPPTPPPSQLPPSLSQHCPDSFQWPPTTFQCLQSSPGAPRSSQCS